MTECDHRDVVRCGLRGSVVSPPRGDRQGVAVNNAKTTGGYVLANGVDRATADELRKRNDGAVVSRNADGTYRVTRAR